MVLKCFFIFLSFSYFFSSCLPKKNLSNVEAKKPIKTPPSLEMNYVYSENGETVDVEFGWVIGLTKTLRSDSFTVDPNTKIKETRQYQCWYSIKTRQKKTLLLRGDSKTLAIPQLDWKRYFFERAAGDELQFRGYKTSRKEPGEHRAFPEGLATEEQMLDRNSAREELQKRQNIAAMTHSSVGETDILAERARNLNAILDIESNFLIQSLTRFPVDLEILRNHVIEKPLFGKSLHQIFIGATSTLNYLSCGTIIYGHVSFWEAFGVCGVTAAIMFADTAYSADVEARIESYKKIIDRDDEKRGLYVNPFPSNFDYAAFQRLKTLVRTSAAENVVNIGRECPNPYNLSFSF